MKRSLLSLALLGVASCAVGPDFQRPPSSAAPATYMAADESLPVQAALGQKISADWWTLFGNQDLNQLVTTVLSGNPDLEAATATLNQYRQQALAVDGALYPQLGLHGGAAREKVNFTSYGMTAPSATLNLFSVGANISYALDVFGHDRRQSEAAAAGAEAAEYRMTGAYLTIAGTAVMQALTLASLDAQIDVVTALVQADQRQLDLLTLARQTGTISDRELASGQGQLAADSAQLPPLKMQLAAVRHGLSILAGKAPSQWSPPYFQMSAFAVPQSIPLSLPSELVRQRPDIMAAEADLHAASAAIGVAKANRFPRIVLSADATQWATLPGHLWHDAATGANAGGGITAPLFQGGQLEAQQRMAESAYQAAEARYRQTVLASFAQVATALQAVGQDRDQLTQDERATNAAAAAAHYAELEQHSGTRGLLPLLAAQRQDFLSRLALIQIQTRYLQDSAELLLAMGGGWK